MLLVCRWFIYISDISTSFYCQTFLFEPRHDKTNKMSVRPAKTQISLGIRLSVFPVRMKKAWVLSYPFSAQRRLWSDWPDAQADLSLRWAHCHFIGFVMSRLIYPDCDCRYLEICSAEFMAICVNSWWDFRQCLSITHFPLLNEKIAIAFL